MTLTLVLPSFAANLAHEAAFADPCGFWCLIRSFLLMIPIFQVKDQARGEQPSAKKFEVWAVCMVCSRIDMT
jgi:hypothetical protein